VGGSGGCATGFRDCNQLPIDGCETDIRNDPRHCGDCLTSCASGALCIQEGCEGPLVSEPVGLVQNPGILYFGRAALAVDASDVPYAAFVTEGLNQTLATFRFWPFKRTAANTWTAQMVSPDLTSGANYSGLSNPGLAAGPNGEICYAIQDYTPPCSPGLSTCQDSLRFGCLGSPTTTLLATPTWSTIFAPPSWKVWNQLAIDPLGTPIVAYGPTTTYPGVRVLYNTDGPVDSTGNGVDMTIHQDPTGAIEAVYINSSGHPTYASWNGTSWTTSVIDTAASTSNECVSMALDGARVPHVLYADKTAGQLLLATFDGSKWTPTPVRGLGPGETSFAACALALDGGGAPHVAYVMQSSTMGNTSINYAVFNGSGWSTATIAPGTFFILGLSAPLLPDHVELALGPSGKPHILVSASNAHSLSQATQDYDAYYLYLP
jgi:hypothetical protein